MAAKTKEERQKRQESRKRFLEDVYQDMRIVTIIDKHINNMFEEIHKISTYKTENRRLVNG